jgi:hypothetical protein
LHHSPTLVLNFPELLNSLQRDAFKPLAWLPKWRTMHIVWIGPGPE